MNAGKVFLIGGIGGIVPNPAGTSKNLKGKLWQTLALLAKADSVEKNWSKHGKTLGAYNLANVAVWLSPTFVEKSGVFE